MLTGNNAEKALSTGGFFLCSRSSFGSDPSTPHVRSGRTIAFAVIRLLRFASTSVNCYLRDMRLTLVFILITTSVLISSKARALTCEDVADADKAEGAGGAILLLTGCTPTNTSAVVAAWDQLTPLMRAHFSSSLLIPGSAFPNDDQALIEMVGNGETLLQRYVAMNWRDVSAEWEAAWESVVAQYPEGLSPLEEALRGRDVYFDSVPFDATVPDWAPSTARFTQVVGTTDIPFLRVAYARMLQDGRWLVAEEEEFLNIYAELSDTYVDAAWLLADYYISQIDSGKNDYRKFLPKVKQLLEFAADSGFILAMDSLANELNVGSALNMDEAAATKIYQTLATYGEPRSQANLGFQLLYGYGIAQNIPVGLDWLNLAQEKEDSIASEYLFDYWISQGNYKKALESALYLAELGYVSFTSKGYAAAKILAPASGINSEDLQKLQEYLLYHCANNWRVDDPEQCSVLGSDSALFASNPSLIDAWDDPASLRYQDAVELSTGDFIALVIANDEYDNWDKLRTPKNDAQLVGSVLSERFGFDVSYLYNASRRDTLKAIYELSSEVAFNDHVLVYYAGHGVRDDITDTAYWIPSDAPRDLRFDWISADEILTGLKAIQSRHLLLVADSCYSGKLLRGAAPTERNPGAALVERMFSKKARVAITSGGDEPVADGSSDGAHSIFAKSFVSALASVKSPLPASTIFNQILEEVAMEASQTPEYAHMRELGHDGGDFIFVPK